MLADSTPKMYSSRKGNAEIATLAHEYGNGILKPRTKLANSIGGIFCTDTRM